METKVHPHKNDNSEITATEQLKFISGDNSQIEHAWDSLRIIQKQYTANIQQSTPFPLFLHGGSKTNSSLQRSQKKEETKLCAPTPARNGYIDLKPLLSC